jgi:hypothetical protein
MGHFDLRVHRAGFGGSFLICSERVVGACPSIAASCAAVAGNSLRALGGQRQREKCLRIRQKNSIAMPIYRYV